MYQAYSRVPQRVEADALETARLLLAAGADPNAGCLWHGARPPFTVLTGLFGAGERDQPRHEHALALARILLDAGADPADEQLLYNQMFRPTDDHLELLFAHGLGSTDRGRTLLRWLLHWAVTHDQRDRVALLARHGVDIAEPLDFTLAAATTGRTPVEIALLNGHLELADLLGTLGGGAATLTATDRFVADALAGSEAGVRGADPDVVERARQERPSLVVWAAALDRPRTVSLLVAAGFRINALGRGDTTIEQKWETALHVAAAAGNLDLAELLLSLGADPTIRDRRFDATALEWAGFFDRPDLVRRLAQGR
jgi:ankyrin repeat protein